MSLRAPTLQDPTGDVDRLIAELIRITPTREIIPENIKAPLRVLQRISHTLRETSFRLTAVVAQTDSHYELIDVRKGHDESDCLGLAIDVGTTTLSLYLVNITAGEILNRLVIENPQTIHGEDILTRIHFCQGPAGLETMQKLALEGINRGIGRLADSCGVAPHDIYAVSMAGNPTMTHLVLGLNPYHLCREPYVPVVSRPPLFRAKEIGVNAHPDAPVYVFPGLSNYFGGDVVAGILASGMHKSKDISLLVDVGTNAEIVLGNRDWLVVCAGAAGPALESGGAKAGMRATASAIEKIRLDRETLEPSFEVIGNRPPEGICGSGLIELVAELFLSKAIDPKGRFADHLDVPRIRTADGVKGFAVVLAEKGEGPKDIIVDELDIGNLLRAKGAMYTALALVTERLGVAFSDLETFFVAGSFGEHVDPGSAITIGMLPDIPLERFRVLGNSAGIGACLMLVSYGLREEVESIRRKAAYIQLTTDNEFMNRLNAALFIPHTNKELFPTVFHTR